MTLTPQQMCDDAFVPRIARLLASFHAVRVDLPREPRLFLTIRGWLQMAEALKFETSDPKAAAYAALDFRAIEGELEKVEAACAAAGSPVVFGHNDLLVSAAYVIIYRLLCRRGHACLKTCFCVCAAAARGRRLHRPFSSGWGRAAPADALPAHP
jgi:hypothetical protein